jgi:hypothetical protein
MADKERREGGGKSPTKFMERPGSKKSERKDEDIRKEESHPEFIEDDLDALEHQETYDEEEASKNRRDVSRPGHKGDEKPDPRKYQDPTKTDVGPEQGDTAC